MIWVVWLMSLCLVESLSYGVGWYGRLGMWEVWGRRGHWCRRKGSCDVGSIEEDVWSMVGISKVIMSGDVLEVYEFEELGSCHYGVAKGTIGFNFWVNCRSIWGVTSVWTWNCVKYVDFIIAITTNVDCRTRLSKALHLQGHTALWPQLCTITTWDTSNNLMINISAKQFTVFNHNQANLPLYYLLHQPAPECNNSSQTSLTQCPYARHSNLDPRKMPNDLQT